MPDSTLIIFLFLSPSLHTWTIWNSGGGLLKDLTFRMTVINTRRSVGSETLWSANLGAQPGVMKPVPHSLAESWRLDWKCKWKEHLKMLTPFMHRPECVVMLRYPAQVLGYRLITMKIKTANPEVTCAISPCSHRILFWIPVNGKVSEWTPHINLQSFSFFKCLFFESSTLPHLGNCVRRNYFNIRFLKTVDRPQIDQASK